jgi:enoyl-[acyl-carrier protein] reductase I
MITASTCNLQRATRNLQRATRNLQRAACDLQRATCNVQRATCNVQPATFNLQPATFNLQRSTCNAQPATCNPKPSTCNLQPATPNLQRATCNLQPQTFNVQPATCNPKPSTCNLPRATCHLQPATCNLQPQTFNVQPATCHVPPATCNLQPATHSIIPAHKVTALFFEEETMGLLQGKKGLVMGVANDHSIAWGIAKALHAQGADLGFTYVGEALERRVRPLAESLGARLIEPCDVQRDEDIDALMARVRDVYGSLDIIIHAIAFALRDELNGPYLKTTREGFRVALDVSAYSLTGVVKAAQDLLVPGASIVTLTYHGSQQVAQNYNVMGVAKAALEASVRYLANDLGPRGIRVNAISAGPIRTLAASGIAGFRTLHKQFAEVAPLRRNVTIEDVGNAAVWLCSDWSSAVTGEIVYVDAGFHTISISLPE